MCGLISKVCKYGIKITPEKYLKPPIKDKTIPPLNKSSISSFFFSIVPDYCFFGPSLDELHFRQCFYKIKQNRNTHTRSHTSECVCAHTHTQSESCLWRLIVKTNREGERWEIHRVLNPGTHIYSKETDQKDNPLQTITLCICGALFFLECVERGTLINFREHYWRLGTW